jgi:hypothetical protein
MRRVSLLAGLLMARAALAQVSVVGDIVVIQDPTGAITNLVTSTTPVIFPSPQEQFCRAAYNQMRTVLPDEYDGVISFTTSESLTDLNNVWQGSPVRAAGTGYGRQNAPWVNTYNGQKISQCVFMGTLGRVTGFIPGLPGPEPLPPNPDSEWAPSVGIPIPGVKSLTGIEMLGHEYGHHWLLGIEFDQNDGRGRQHFIRGYIEGGDPMTQGYPSQHYSHFADSRSVMYGECITDLGNGSFEVRGCQRKYSQIDQYLMGLRAPTEVAPMMVLESAAMDGKGAEAVAMAASASPTTVTGMIRHDITVDEIIRAMGARIPAYPNAQNCWRVAFVVVLAPGQTSVPPAMLQKVEAYRARWGPWFRFATDGRGTMDTRINGTGCLATPPADGGVVVPDAGPTVDAGQPDSGQPSEEDAGLGEPDAGMEAPDAGGEVIADGGVSQPPDAGPSKWDTYVPMDTGKIRPGCGCGATGGLEVLALLALVGGALRCGRRRAVWGNAGVPDGRG